MASQFVESIMGQVTMRNPGETEFHQAVREVAESVEVVIEKNPEFAKMRVLERLVEPERQIMFRVPWVDDKGQVQINRGFRVQFSSAIGPYKGGMRFHPSVYLGIIKFLGFEQIFKNALTTTPIGGGKGGSDFDPKGKSDNEVMRFCQSFMSELFRHIGADTDVPAGDIGVGGREVGYHVRPVQETRPTVFTGVLTGKGLDCGGSLARTEATGYGLVYFVTRMLQDRKTDWKGKKVVVSGSGNVAIYAVQKAQELGAKVDRHVRQQRLHRGRGGHQPGHGQADQGSRTRPHQGVCRRAQEAPSTSTAAQGIWTVPCDIALPIATQNEMDEAGAKALVKNKCIAVGEGANMPSTPEADRGLPGQRRVVRPGQGRQCRRRGHQRPGNVPELDAAELDVRGSRRTPQDDHERHLRPVRRGRRRPTACKGNLVAGANIAGFLKVAKAMMAQGVV